MSPLRDDEITTLLRDEVNGLASGPGSVDDVLRLGRRRIVTRRFTAGAGALAVAAVVVVGLQVTGPADDRGLPAEEPSVTLTEEPATAPDPQPVYDALEVRLAEMGLPPDLGRWSAGPVPDGVALSVIGPGFALESTHLQEPAAWVTGPVFGVEEPGCDAYRATLEVQREEVEGTGMQLLEFECEDLPQPDGRLWVLSLDGEAQRVTFHDGSVRVSATVANTDPATGTVRAVLGRDQLVELATDPGLRWQ